MDSCLCKYVEKVCQRHSCNEEKDNKDVSIWDDNDVWVQDSTLSFIHARCRVSVLGSCVGGVYVI